jgi:hypothetical protein
VQEHAKVQVEHVEHDRFMAIPTSAVELAGTEYTQAVSQYNNLQGSASKSFTDFSIVDLALGLPRHLPSDACCLQPHTPLTMQLINILRH